MSARNTPVVIVGSGIAGLLTAIKLSAMGVQCTVMTKSSLQENSSWMAQGGIAAVLPANFSDSLDLHVKDTVYAGAGLVDEIVARSILSEGHLAINDLLDLGVPFDTENGHLAFTKEAAHTTQRILHAGGDATGRSILDTLIRTVQADPNIDVLEHCWALQLLVSNGQCHGLVMANVLDAHVQPMVIEAQHVILSTGGLGQLYSHTTNPAIATGDGVALAYEAGANIQDIEFVQFHPTAFWHQGDVRFLVSEALRGEGGILRNHAGEAFAHKYHESGELAPRDVVTRAISSEINAGTLPHVWLDMTHLSKTLLEQRFPTIFKACLSFGVDLRQHWIPVAPAAHYAMGGIQVTPQGQTSIQNLHAVGEVVSTGLHGANRLASNSLLECVVLARRVALDVQQSLEKHSKQPFLTSLPVGYPLHAAADCSSDVAQRVQTLQNVMWQFAGILRDETGLKQALDKLDELECQADKAQDKAVFPWGVAFCNMLTTAKLICQAALERQESRGAHYRSDYPETSQTALHSVYCLASGNASSLKELLACAHL